ncbi:uncharacterized protein LOC126887303 [Diabrotica virgifera virgifera]|uniref:Uncharacterized protein n=1 Tax=Diabrotica virgifera virgifera TaxID=50390 RepID=A0ABM5KKF8_DIAVI|nr:uncharacterized protein LOC126887303 [Diabrotica virgifera virgifera]
MTKLTLFFCAIILASAYSYPKNVSDDSDDCIDTIKAIVYITEIFIDLFLKAAPQLIDEIKDIWSDFEVLEVDIASSVYDVIFELVNDKLRTWSENTTDAGKKLANCLIDANDAAAAVPMDFINHTLVCSGDDFIALVKSLPALIEDLTDVQVDAKRAADKINDCDGHDYNTALCVLDVNSFHTQLLIPEYDNLIDTIKELIHNVEKTLDRSIEDVTKAISEIDHNYTGSQNKIVNAWAKIINGIFKKLTNVLDRIAEDSTALGKKLAKCFEDSNINLVPVLFVNLTLSCIEDDVIKVAESLGPLVKQLAEVQKKAKAATENIDECGDNITDIGCVLKVAVDLVRIAGEIPAIIESALAPIEGAIENLIKIFQTCAKDNNHPNAAKILGQIGNCVRA